jgi:hypothetical protein
MFCMCIMIHVPTPPKPVGLGSNHVDVSALSKLLTTIISARVTIIALDGRPSSSGLRGRRWA